MTDDAEADTALYRDMPVSPEAEAEGRSYKWWVIVMLWFVCFLNNADRQGIPAVLPKLKELFHFSPLWLGVIGSAFAWVYAFGSPIAGFLGDRLHRKRLIFGACGFWSLIAACTGLCSKLWQFILVRAMVGIGETVYFPASMSMISDYHGARSRSKAMSFHQSSVYVGGVLGTWLTALIAEKYSWRLGFFIFGGAGIVLMFVLMIFLREPRRGRLELGGNARKPAPVLGLKEIEQAIFRKPTAILLMLAFLLANFVANIFYVWTVYFLKNKFHFPLATAGLWGSVFIFSGCALSVPFGGIFADMFSHRLAGGRILVQAIGLLFSTSFVFIFGNTTSKETLVIAMCLYGIGKGFYDANIFASMYDVVELRACATAAGLMNTTGWFGGALGPLFVGLFMKYGHGTESSRLSHAFSATALVYIASAALLLVAAFVFAPRDKIRVVAPSGFPVGLLDDPGPALPPPSH